jgi:cytochrome c biogenesis protein CcmG/thiol:disulfide interchange protein DsbE
VRSKYPTFILTVGFAAILAVVGCRSNRSEQSNSANPQAVKVPPEVNLALPTLDGGNTTISEYKGKVVLVNFWATWCQPCQKEIPWLIEFNEKYGPKGLVILGISMDDEGKKVVEPYVKDRHFDVNGHSETMNYRILLGSDAIADKFGGLLGLPTSVLYSRDGQKVKTIIGLADYGDLSKTLEKQL